MNIITAPCGMRWQLLIDGAVWATGTLWECIAWESEAESLLG